MNCNGYSNPETLLIAQWIDNDEGIYSNVQWAIKELLEEEKLEVDDAVVDLEKNLRQLVEGNCPYIVARHPLASSRFNIYRQLLCDAMNNINYYELALDIIDEYLENQK